MSGRVWIGYRTVVLYSGTDPETAKIVSVENAEEPEEAESLMGLQPRPEELAWMYVTLGARLEGFDKPSKEWVPPAMPEGAIH